jgi:hypothetical protein
MAYSDIALLNSDNDFILRTRACASTEGESDPVAWTNEHMWQVSGAPGFGEAYGYAVMNGHPRPGNDVSVISDGMILSAVQAINGTPAAAVATDANDDPARAPREGA